MIYDCTLFYNEFDMLDLRLHELNDVVDKFLVAEANITMNNEKKPFYLKENLDKFSDFKDKLIPLQVNLEQLRESPWFREFKLRNYMGHYLKKELRAKPKDIILMTNMDEIVSSKAVKFIDQEMDIIYTKFEQKFHYYWLNCASPLPWHGPSVISFNHINHYFKSMYIKTDNPFKIIKDGGFHFSYLGGVQAILDKLHTFAHCEDDLIKSNSDPKWIEKCIVAPKDLFSRSNIILSFVNIDSSYPKYILENLEKFKQYIYKPEEYVKI